MRVRKIGTSTYNQEKALIVEALTESGEGRRLYQIVGYDLLEEEIFRTGECELSWLKEEDLLTRI